MIITQNHNTEPKYNSLDLAVIESRWWKQGNHSVRGIFDALAGIHVDNPYGYHYEMFNNTESIKELLPRLIKDSTIHYVYVSAHGGVKEISGAADNRISRTVLKNIFEHVHGKQLYGVFFGSCCFGCQTQELMGRKNGATWIAGYEKDIDWIEAAALDMFFWNDYYTSDVVSAPSKKVRAERMIEFLKRLRNRVGYMFEDMGFKVSVNHQKGKIFTFPDDFN